MRKTLNDGNTKDIKIAVSLKYLNNYVRNLEIPLNNCEINLMFTWSENCVSTSSTDTGTLAITYTKRDASVVSILTNDNKTLLRQLNSRQHLNARLTGTNIHQKFQRKHKTNI